MYGTEVVNVSLWCSYLHRPQYNQENGLGAKHEVVDFSTILAMSLDISYFLGLKKKHMSITLNLTKCILRHKLFQMNEKYLPGSHIGGQIKVFHS